MNIDSAQATDSLEHTANRDIAEDARGQWTTVIRAQIHFNEIIQRTRQMTGTVVVAAYGGAAAAFSAKPAALMHFGSIGLGPIHPAAAIAVLGIVFLVVGYAMDRFYYFRLLIAAVEVGEQLENKFDLPAKLTAALTSRVGRLTASIVTNLFYFVGLAIGVSLVWAIDNAMFIIN